jgi:large subunit ribosomal protein L6
MSRVGKSPVTVPDGTQVTIDGHIVSAKGKLGELSIVLTPDVEISLADNQITVMPRSKTKRAQMMWGTSRNLIDNLVTGVTEGYSKTLEITGVGYRAAVQGRTLTLQLGYSHDVVYPIPEGIDIKCGTPTVIVVSGADKQRVGQVAAEIRAYRKPEPYKGKGIRYQGEIILRKEGKKK